MDNLKWNRVITSVDFFVRFVLVEHRSIGSLCYGFWRRARVIEELIFFFFRIYLLRWMTSGRAKSCSIETIRVGWTIRTTTSQVSTGCKLFATRGGTRTDDDDWVLCGNLCLVILSWWDGPEWLRARMNLLDGVHFQCQVRKYLQPCSMWA